MYGRLGLLLHKYNKQSGNDGLYHLTLYLIVLIVYYCMTPVIVTESP